LGFEVNHIQIINLYFRNYRLNIREQKNIHILVNIAKTYHQSTNKLLSKF